MSDVRDFYNAHHSNFDGLHALLDKEPAIRAQLPAIRQRMLSCCGAEKSESGEIKLTIADQATWDALSLEVAKINNRLEAIDRAVEVIDAIFDEINAAYPGIEMYRKTPHEIWAIESGRRTKVIHPDTGKDIDPWGRPVPQKRDEQWLAWAERAEAALAEAQKIVG